MVWQRLAFRAAGFAAGQLLGGRRGGGVQLNFRMKDAFLDRSAISNAIDRERKRALSRQGGLVRTIAKRSLKKKANPSATSPAGSPPYSHAPHNLRRLLWYAYSPFEQSVIVGPVGFGRSGKPVPEIHEKGGTATIVVPKKGKGRRKKFGRKTTKKTVHYSERPFMGPSRRTAAPHFPEMWRDSVK